MARGRLRLSSAPPTSDWITRNSGPSGEALSELMSETLFLIRGIDTVPPRTNVLAETLYDGLVKLPSAVVRRIWEAVILLSSPWNPPTRKLASETMSDG